MSEKDFIGKWVNNLRDGGLKNFPEDFMIETETENVSLKSKTLVLGPELFGTWEINDTQGSRVVQAGSLIKAKYILYSNRTLPERITVPKSEDANRQMVKLYEKYLDGLVMEIIKEFRNQFPEKKNFFEVSNKIFNSLNLCRY